MNPTPHTTSAIAFIGGGNMASAIIGGLLKKGTPPAQIQVLEPFEAQRGKLQSQFGVGVHGAAGEFLQSCGLVVWAVKPQTFKEAALACAAHTRQALHLSVAAGITSSSMAQWLVTERIVRSMPNTPALVGKGITGLFARAAASAADRAQVEQIIGTTGEWVWLEHEQQLDAVTALSGSGPAYVFYFIEAMVSAGQSMGLSAEQSRQLAVATFAGAAHLAHESTEPVSLLRERVTSKGGTTYAALTLMQREQVAEVFVRAMQAAGARAKELGDEFGA
jgi:pyrroline-5-carboxylate reductase